MNRTNWLWTVSEPPGVAVVLLYWRPRFWSADQSAKTCRNVSSCSCVVTLNAVTIFVSSAGRHQFVFLYRDFDLRVFGGIFDRYTDEAKPFAEQIRIRLFRFLVFRFDWTNCRGRNDQRRKKLMVHIRFRRPFDFISVE